MSRFQRASDAAMAAFAVALAAHLAFSAHSVGDYSADGGPALDALLHHGLGAFARATPAMGSLSLLVRAPFALIPAGASQLEVYRWGALPCVLAVAALALALARIARRRGTGALGQWAIVLVALLNPMVSSVHSRRRCRPRSLARCPASAICAEYLTGRACFHAARLSGPRAQTL